MNKLRMIAVLAALCALLCGTALADIPPAPQSGVNTYVFDHTGRNLISDQDRQVIDKYARELERQTGAQAVVVLVNFLDGDEAGIYAHDLFNAWGIGQKGKDNGLLLLCARAEREVFLYTGAGIEHMLTAAMCDRILGDYAVPKLAHGDYSGGLRDAFVAACDRLAQAYGVTLSAGGSSPQTGSGGGGIGEFFSGLFGSSSNNYRYEYEYSHDSRNTGNNREGGGWVRTLVIILILFFVLGGGRRRRYRTGGGGCFPFLLGGFLGSAMRRGRGPFHGPRTRPMGGFPRPGGSKPGGGFKPGGGMGRGGGAGRKF